MARFVHLGDRHRDHRHHERAENLHARIRDAILRFQIGSDGVLAAPEVLQHVAEPDQRLRGIFLATLRVLYQREVVESAGVKRVRGCRLPVAFLGFCEPLLLPEHVAEVERGVGESWIDLQRAAKRRFRVGQTRNHREGIAEIAPCRGVAVVCAHRPLQELGRGFPLPRAVLDEAEIVERVRVRGLARQDRAVAGFGFGVPAGLMQAHGLLQGVSHEWGKSEQRLQNIRSEFDQSLIFYYYQ